MILPPIAAEEILQIGNLPITNSMVNAWIAAAIFVIFAAAVSRRQALVPRGFQNAAEAMTEFFLTNIQSVTGDRIRARKFLPIVGSIFLFILVSNWMGLIPGTGSIGIYELHHGEVALVPILRPASSDLNMTLAIAAFSVIVSHIFGVFAIGFFKHLNKFIQLGTMFSSFKKGGIHIFTGIVELGVGFIELISEAAKVVSLSLRLFGNIFAGEVLLTVIAGLIAFFVPLPFMALEIIVGVIQAMVFALLTLVYLTVATEKIH